MNGNIWWTFLALVGMLMLGYELGRIAMSRKISGLLKQVSDMLKETAEKMRQDQEKQKIERAARIDDLMDDLTVKLRNIRTTAERMAGDGYLEKEGDAIESNQDG